MAEAEAVDGNSSSTSAGITAADNGSNAFSEAFTLKHLIYFENASQNNG